MNEHSIENQNKKDFNKYWIKGHQNDIKHNRDCQRLNFNENEMIVFIVSEEYLNP